MSDFQSEPSSLDRTDRSVCPRAFSSVRRVKAKSRQKTVSALHVMNFSFQLKTEERKQNKLLFTFTTAVFLMNALDLRTFDEAVYPVELSRQAYKF